MSYTSLFFLVFCAAALGLYYLVGRKGQLWVLAVANLTFYAIAGVKYLPFILVTMVATYVCGRYMDAAYSAADVQLAACSDAAEKKAIRTAAKKRAKRFLLGALFVSVGLLAVCKYTLFAVSNINGVLAALGGTPIGMFKMILPLGISFYTFMALSYILDVYWKRYRAEKNFLMYAVYLSYFPHVVQGPIDRFNEFKEQIKDGVALSYKNITYGAQLALWGFFKKLVIADRLGLFVDEVIGNWDKYSGIVLIVAIVVYSIQIYADFSGCIDIVSGISEMFGIRLRKNFNHPYFSKTMGEFWRRWHISLQEWFKDYIYYPVSASSFTKNIKKRFKNKGLKRAEELFASCFPVLVVWLITGLWHGAAWKFVAWGLFHAALLIGSQVFDPLFKKTNEKLHVNTDRFLWQLWQMIRTFFLCCVGRVFFRANGLTHAFQLFKKMVTDLNVAAFLQGGAVRLLAKNVILLGVFGVILIVISALQEKMSLRETLAKKPLVFRWLLIFGMLFAVILIGVYGPGYDAKQFIYEQF